MRATPGRIHRPRPAEPAPPARSRSTDAAEAPARRVGARKRGPSGDLTAETRVRPVVTRYWPATRSHPRKRGPCSTFHRPVTTQAPHLAQPNNISTLSRDRAIRAACRSADQGPLRGCDRGGTHKPAHIRHDASRSGVASIGQGRRNLLCASSGRSASAPPYVRLRTRRA